MIGKIDLIYNQVDQLLLDGNYAQCDATLQNLEVKQLHLDEMLSYLTATLPAKSHLPSRGVFYRAVEKEIRSRGAFEEGLLDGLA